jgi:hypothetical protein
MMVADRSPTRSLSVVVDALLWKPSFLSRLGSAKTTFLSSVTTGLDAISTDKAKDTADNGLMNDANSSNSSVTDTDIEIRLLARWLNSHESKLSSEPPPLLLRETAEEKSKEGGAENITDWGLLSRLLSSGKHYNGTVKQALTEHVSNSLKEWKEQRKASVLNNNSTTIIQKGWSLLEAVSNRRILTTCYRSETGGNKGDGLPLPAIPQWRGGTSYIPPIGHGGSDDLGLLDRLARGLVLNLGKIVAAQSLMTFLKSRELFVIQEVVLFGKKYSRQLFY